MVALIMRHISRTQWHEGKRRNINGPITKEGELNLLRNKRAGFTKLMLFMEKGVIGD